MEEENCKFKNGEIVWDPMFKEKFEFEYRTDKTVIHRLEHYINQDDELTPKNQ